MKIKAILLIAACLFLAACNSGFQGMTPSEAAAHRLSVNDGGPRGVTSTEVIVRLKDAVEVTVSAKLDISFCPAEWKLQNAIEEDIYASSTYEAAEVQQAKKALQPEGPEYRRTVSHLMSKYNRHGMVDLGLKLRTALVHWTTPDLLNTTNQQAISAMVASELMSLGSPHVICFHSATFTYTFPEAVNKAVAAQDQAKEKVETARAGVEKAQVELKAL